MLEIRYFNTRLSSKRNEGRQRKTLNNEFLRNSNLFRHPSCFLIYEASTQCEAFSLGNSSITCRTTLSPADFNCAGLRLGVGTLMCFQLVFSDVKVETEKGFIGGRRPVMSTGIHIYEPLSFKTVETTSTFLHNKFAGQFPVENECKLSRCNCCGMKAFKVVAFKS